MDIPEPVKKDSLFDTLVWPLLLLGIYIAVLFFIRGQLPDPKTLIASIKEFYSVYGYFFSFFGAFLEGLFLVGMYIPGSTVVLLSAVMARAGVLSFPVAYLLATAGFLLAYCINYALGRYGWYHILAKFGMEGGITMAKNKLHEQKSKAILVGYIIPGSAAFLSTAAGVTHYPFRDFFLASLVAQLFWGLVWGGLAYIFGLPLVEFILKYFIFVIIAVGVGFVVKSFLWK